MNSESLGERMKQYESVTDIEMTRRMPVVIRVDGRAFHSFSRGLDTFDDDLIETMSHTAQELCKDIHGSAFAFVQSDEISVLVTPYTSLNFEPYFGNRVQKITSVSASVATRAFNSEWEGEESAEFDCRVFPLPRHEVVNYFIWRQLDWERNSIHMLGRKYFSHNEMHGLSNDEVQEKLWQEEDVNWANLENHLKNGVSLYQKEETVPPGELHPKQDEEVTRSYWYIDRETPVFTENRDFIEQWVYENEEEK